MTLFLLVPCAGKVITGLTDAAKLADVKVFRSAAKIRELIIVFFVAMGAFSW